MALVLSFFFFTLVSGESNRAAPQKTQPIQSNTMPPTPHELQAGRQAGSNISTYQNTKHHTCSSLHRRPFS